MLLTNIRDVGKWKHCLDKAFSICKRLVEYCMMVFITLILHSEKIVDLFPNEGSDVSFMNQLEHVMSSMSIH